MRLKLIYGTNLISKRELYEIFGEVNWNSFLWYLADYVKIKSFNDDFVGFDAVSDKQANFLSKIILDYNDMISSYNFDIDKNNDLWKTHKRGIKYNFKILEKLVYGDNYV